MKAARAAGSRGVENLSKALAGALTPSEPSPRSRLLQPPTDMLHGDRTVVQRDPFGHLWVFPTHQEDVPEDESRRRLAASA
jgi:PhnB protein